jgi:hypothetical protein
MLSKALKGLIPAQPLNLYIAYLSDFKERDGIIYKSFIILGARTAFYSLKP